MTIYFPPSLKHLDVSWPIPSHAAGSCAIIFDLIYALQPELSVCVNTIEAALYMTAAQAISKSDTDGIVFAATNWINEEKFLEIQQFSRSHYASISYMMREALHSCPRHYSNDSIKLIVLQTSNINDDDLNSVITMWHEKLSDDGLMVIKHEKTQSIQPQGSPPYTLIEFPEESTSILTKELISSEVKKIIDVINTDKGKDFYRHASQFINNRSQLQRSEKTKLINQIKKQISKSVEQHG